MQALITILILFAAVVNLVPVTGVLSAERLRALYGMAFDGGTLLILMRHRAVLFGIVGTLLLVSAFHRPLRAAAVVAGLVSMLSFVVIAKLQAGANPELERLVTVDLVASAGLVAAVLLDRFSQEG
jgi:hypothetical protein